MASQSPVRETPAGRAGSPPEDADLAANRDTLDAYEGYARTYTERTEADHSASSDALRELVAAVGSSAHVLEIGSGPGWDADHLESLGLRVRRTDATVAFCDVQAERGKHVDVVDVLVDPLGGPYDGVMAMYVLQHVARAATAGVVGRIADALRPGGVFLVALREGEGEECERGDVSGAYHVVLRGEAEFEAELKTAGLEPVWRQRYAGTEGDWLTWLARKAG
jgi:SAM-dependent methyltransferase